MNLVNNLGIVINVNTNHKEIIREMWYFAQLFNQILPKTGINSYFETIADGFLLFCQLKKDFIKIYTSVLERKDFEGFAFSSSLIAVDAEFYWEFRVLERADFENDDMIANVVGNYWKPFNATLTIHEKNNTKYYRINFSSVEHYKACQDLIIKGLKKRLSL